MMESRTGAVAALVAGATFGLHRIIDPDVFLQVAVGRAIVRKPGSLGISTFIESQPGHPYVEDKWLASVLVALVEAVGGIDGLMVYQVMLCALVAGAWYWMQRAWHASPSAALVGTALALLACNFRLEPRPDTLSHALLALAIGLSATTMAFRRLAWIVPLLCVLWVNVHGYFVNGLLVFLATVVTGALGDRTAPPMPAAPGGSRTRAWLVLAGLGLAACLLHPQGWHALASPLTQLLALRDPTLSGGIAEFSPSWRLLSSLDSARWLLLGGTLIGALVLGMTAVGHPALVRQGVALVVALPWLVWPPDGLRSMAFRLTFVLLLMATFELSPNVRERRLLGPLLLIGMSVLAAPLIRNLPLLVPAALILLAPAWSTAGAELGRAWSGASAQRFLTIGVVLVLVGTITYRLSDRLSAGVGVPSRTGWGVETDFFPGAAIDLLERERLPGPLLNNFDLGGYLLYRLHPERRVFIAGNTSMYPPTFLAYYRTHVSGVACDLDALHGNHGVRTVVVALASIASRPLIVALSAHPDWTLVFLDRAGAVWVRVDESTRGGAQRLRVDVARRVAALAAADHSAPMLPEWLGGKHLPFPALNLALFLQTAGRPELALGEARRIWAQAPSPEGATVIGQTAWQLGRLAAELPTLRRAAAEFPESEQLQGLLSQGLADQANDLLGRGSVDAAEEVLREMLTVTPDACGPYVGLAKIAAFRNDRDEVRRLLAEMGRKDGAAACRAGAAADAVLGPLLPADAPRPTAR